MENQFTIKGVRVDGVITLVVLVAWIFTRLRYLDKIGFSLALTYR